jgi:hypothetical protein
MVEDVYGSAV